MKKILKIVFLMVCLVVVGLVGLFLYDNFMPSRAKKEDVEFCECLKDYKIGIKCSKYGFGSQRSAIAYYEELNNSFLIAISIKNPNVLARKKYEEMRLQWDLCQMRIKDCFLCDNKPSKNKSK